MRCSYRRASHPTVRLVPCTNSHARHPAAGASCSRTSTPTLTSSLKNEGVAINFTTSAPVFFTSANCSHAFHVSNSVDQKIWVTFLSSSDPQSTESSRRSFRNNERTSKWTVDGMRPVSRGASPHVWSEAIEKPTWVSQQPCCRSRSKSHFNP